MRSGSISIFYRGGVQIPNTTLFVHTTVVFTHYPLYDFDLRAAHAHTLLPAALASVSFGFVLVRVRVLVLAQGVKKQLR